MFRNTWMYFYTQFSRMKTDIYISILNSLNLIITSIKSQPFRKSIPFPDFYNKYAHHHRFPTQFSHYRHSFLLLLLIRMPTSILFPFISSSTGILFTWIYQKVCPSPQISSSLHPLSAFFSSTSINKNARIPLFPLHFILIRHSFQVDLPKSMPAPIKHHSIPSLFRRYRYAIRHTITDTSDPMGAAHPMG